MHRLSSTSALFALALMVAPAAAQDPEWSSDQNQTWWNGVTQAELQELVAEAGGAWTDLPDQDGVRISKVDWPDIVDVEIREMDCPSPERPMPERNCRTLQMSVVVDQPADLHEWWAGQNGWLTYTELSGTSILFRIERHGFGTSRGHVLSDLMLFRLVAIFEMDRIEVSRSSGW
jgi:hypothetical protein